MTGLKEMMVDGRLALVYERDPANVSALMTGDVANYILLGYLGNAERHQTGTGALSSMVRPLVK